jgi:hypothetical protein
MPPLPRDRNHGAADRKILRMEKMIIYIDAKIERQNILVIAYQTRKENNMPTETIENPTWMTEYYEICKTGWRMELAY